VSAENVGWQLRQLPQIFEWLDDKEGLIEKRKQHFALDEGVKWEDEKANEYAVATFLSNHPRCDVRIRDEYGYYHSKEICG